MLRVFRRSRLHVQDQMLLLLYLQSLPSATMRDLPLYLPKSAVGDTGSQGTVRTTHTPPHASPVLSRGRRPRLIARFGPEKILSSSLRVLFSPTTLVLPRPCELVVLRRLALLARVAPRAADAQVLCRVLTVLLSDGRPGAAAVEAVLICGAEPSLATLRRHVSSHCVSALLTCCCSPQRYDHPALRYDHAVSRRMFLPPPPPCGRYNIPRWRSRARPASQVVQLVAARDIAQALRRSARAPLWTNCGCGAGTRQASAAAAESGAPTHRAVTASSGMSAAAATVSSSWSSVGPLLNPGVVG